MKGTIMVLTPDEEPIIFFTRSKRQLDNWRKDFKGQGYRITEKTI